MVIPLFAVLGPIINGTIKIFATMRKIMRLELGEREKDMW